MTLSFYFLLIILWSVCYFFKDLLIFLGSSSDSSTGFNLMDVGSIKIPYFFTIVAGCSMHLIGHYQFTNDPMFLKTFPNRASSLLNYNDIIDRKMFYNITDLLYIMMDRLMV